MIRLLTVIGARPQIIKAAALSRVIRKRVSSSCERILHTGQHYDSRMSQVFFDELGIPAPDYNLAVGSASHGVQTAGMVEGIERVLRGEMASTGGERCSSWDGVVLYGDTNSTLAGAIAASKLGIPIFHVEAGLRSFNMSMPEEINRIVCDNLSSLLFAPTSTAVANLSAEGFIPSRRMFPSGKGQDVVCCGDVMYDNSIHFGAVVDSICSGEHFQGVNGVSGAAGISDVTGSSADYAAPLSGLAELTERYAPGFVLATVHRSGNTDDPARLSAIFSSLLEIISSFSVEVVLPLHPRTSKVLRSNLSPSLYSSVSECRGLHIIPPASFLEMIWLEKNCSMVLTDSGGVQKEAFFFRRPCVIMRPETEWVEIVDHGAGIVADADFNRIVGAYSSLSGREVDFPPLFGDGRAAEHILDAVIEYLA